MTMNTPGTADDTTGAAARAGAAPGARTAAGRGRHRRPRSRRPLVTAAGLALVAGALSLARLVPDPGAGGMEMTGSAPGQGPVPTTDRAAHLDDAAEAAAHVRPSSLVAEGDDDAHALPEFRVDRDGRQTVPAHTAAVPAGSTASPGIGVGTGAEPAAVLSGLPPAPAAPRDRGPAPAPESPRPPESVRPPLPDPAPTPPPPPEDEADQPGLCVPLVGVCVDLAAGGHR